MIMRFALFRARARVARRKMIGDEEESTPSRARVSVYGMAAPPSSLASPATRGGGASRGGTLTRGPTQTQDASLAQEVRAETLSVRPASTVAAYGDVDDDADSGAGAAREWREWCRSRDGDTLHGVLIEDKPRAYDEIVRPEKVVEFLQRYLRRRPMLDGQRRTVPGTLAGPSAFLKMMKGLVSLWKGARAPAVRAPRARAPDA